MAGNVSIISLSLKEELECTICLDLSISPILTCATGHVICGVCIEKVKICGYCQQPFEPSSLAERLVKKHDVQLLCRNAESGCNLVIKSWKMMDHLMECEYRPIVCFERTKNCGGKISNLNELASHLKEKHDCVEHFEELGSFKFVTSRNSLVPETTNILKNVSKALLRFDGKIFILHETCKEDVIYRWVTVIGGDMEAKAYYYLLKMSPLPLVNTVYKSTATWTLPVLPVCKFHEFETVVDSGYFASIHCKTLETVSRAGAKVCEDTKLKAFKFGWVDNIMFFKNK